MDSFSPPEPRANQAPITISHIKGSHVTVNITIQKYYIDLKLLESAAMGRSAYQLQVVGWALIGVIIL